MVENRVDLLRDQPIELGDLPVQRANATAVIRGRWTRRRCHGSSLLTAVSGDVRHALLSSQLRDAGNHAHRGSQFLELQPRPEPDDRVVRSRAAGNRFHFDTRLTQRKARSYFLAWILVC